MCENGLNKEQKDKIKEICDKFDNDNSELISILHKTQEHFGYLPQVVQEEIALCLKSPAARIYGVITFYSFFTMEPRGRFPISICTGTACYVCGAEKIVEEFERLLGVKIGKTTSDGKFSLDSLRCVGACGLAPVVMIGKKIYGRAKIEDVKDMIRACKE